MNQGSQTSTIAGDRHNFYCKEIMITTMECLDYNYYVSCVIVAY